MPPAERLFDIQDAPHKNILMRPSGLGVESA